MEGRISIKYLANKVEIYIIIDKNTGILIDFPYIFQSTYDSFELHQLVKHTLKILNYSKIWYIIY
jgi:hypothetical protein